MTFEKRQKLSIQKFSREMRSVLNTMVRLKLETYFFICLIFVVSADKPLPQYHQQRPVAGGSPNQGRPEK